MDKILKFIENHLEEPITNAELAKMAGYSESYFLHMFKEKMNESVQSYICRRRLIHSCEDILLGTRLIDVALKYNFMSHSAFSKAFRREFGVSPSLLKFAKYEIKCIGGSAMDKIFIKNLPVGTNKELLYEQLKKSIAEQELDVDENELQKVYELSCKAYQGKKRYSGEEYVTHPISVAIILCEIEAEPEVVLAGLLCDVKENVQECLGKEFLKNQTFLFVRYKIEKSYIVLASYVSILATNVTKYCYCTPSLLLFDYQSVGRQTYMIRCKQVYKTFGHKKVLDGIDFELSNGQIFGLLGPSGAGKTTIIKILTGQLSFDGGEVEIFGKSVNTLTGDDKKNIGIMMDSFGVYDRLSCWDNLKLYADIYGISKTKVTEALQYVGLEEAKNRLAFNLSKGMEARLRLARVLLHSPKVMFLDEPTSGLDPNSMKAIHKRILEKKKEGCTIFLTTHNMEEAVKLCDTVALLNDGKIIECGSVHEICLKYNHKKRMLLHLTTGEDLELDNSLESAKKIYQWMVTNQIETIHSSEPNLETVFLELVGKTLEEKQ